MTSSRPAPPACWRRTRCRRRSATRSCGSRAGRRCSPPAVQAALVSGVRERREPPVVLSPRESDVLRGLARGLSGPQIAAELHLSPSTIKTHLQRLYERLGVSDRAAAVAEGMRRGLIE